MTQAEDASAPLAERLDALLPQTQCRQCLFDGCRPYAEAMARGEAKINRCPPGGEATITKLARALGQTPLPLDPAHGEYRPFAVALIDESRCIGCRLCIKACPVDAIVGAPKLMHTVLTEDCTGCELCLPPCPVDCIDLVAPPRNLAEGPSRADEWRERYERRNVRLAAGDREQAARASRRAARAANVQHVPGRPDRPLDEGDRQAVIRAALARAKARRAARANLPDA
ncbi:MAG: RnfABCDGE type electron transport complex subunit B [Pseudomonadota bacterium]